MELDKIKADALGRIPFLPEEIAYVKAILRQGSNPCAEESIVLCREDEEYVLDWQQLPGSSHQNVAYHSDGHIQVSPQKRQTHVYNATYFVVFNAVKSSVPHFASKIVIWRPYSNIWKVASWLRQKMTERN